MTRNKIRPFGIAADGSLVSSETPGTLGGHRKNRTYGRLDCKAARRALGTGTSYAQQRVFFKDEATARLSGRARDNRLVHFSVPEGATATAVGTSTIGAEVSPGGDRWTFVKRDGRWWISSLTYNLEIE